jgi:hypothetical protein
MRFVFLILTCCLLGMFLLSAKPPVVAQPSASAPPWQEGERLIYSASWADVLAAAEIKFEATGHRLIAGRETRRVSVRARTVGLVDKLLFRVDDLYESFLDPVSFLPLHCENIWRHGKKSEASSYELDHAGRTATLSGGRVLKIPADTYDLAGLAYAVRTIDQERKRSTQLTLLDEERLQPLVFQVEGKESLATPAGEFVAARIAIKLPGEEEGEDHYKLRLFISADSRRLPLRLTAEPGWGSVRMELVTFEGARPVR